MHALAPWIATASLLVAAPALSPDDPPAVPPDEGAEEGAVPFVPFDFGDAPLTSGPLAIAAPGRIPEPVARRLAELRDDAEARLAELRGSEVLGGSDFQLRDRPTVLVAEVGGGLELWIARGYLPYDMGGPEHHHFLHRPADGRVGPTATWTARFWDPTDDELDPFSDVLTADDPPVVVLRRTDLDADGTPELALHSYEHNGTMWNACATLVVDVAADLSLHHALKFYTRIHEVPTGATLVARWEEAPGGPVVHWARRDEDPLLDGPVGRQWLVREGPGRRFELLRHQAEDADVEWLLERAHHEPAGGFAGGR